MEDVAKKALQILDEHGINSARAFLGYDPIPQEENDKAKEQSDYMKAQKLVSLNRCKILLSKCNAVL